MPEPEDIQDVERDETEDPDFYVVAGDANQRNILQVYHKAKEYEWDLGITTYLRYHQRIFQMASKFDMEDRLAVIVAMFVAVSSDFYQDDSFATLQLCLEHFPKKEIPGITTYPTGVDRAIALWEGADPKTIFQIPKTYNYYMNLWNPCHPRYITIDGHMMSVWKGRRVRLKSRETKITGREYRMMADDYKTVARELGLLPSQLQAICWLTWKRLNKIIWNPQMRMWDYAS